MSLKKLFSFVIFLLLTVIIVSACGKDKTQPSDSSSDKKDENWNAIMEKGKLVVATSGTLYPTSYHDSESNELTGYEVEIVKEIGSRLDLNIEFVEMGFDGMLTSLNSGQVDIAVNDIDVTEERKEKFAYTDPYKHSFGSAIVRADDLSGIETLEDLKGKKAAGAATSVYMQIGRDYGVEEVIYDNVTNDVYLRDVHIGRTDVILNDYYLQKLALEAFPEFNLTIHPSIRYHASDQAMIAKKDNVDVVQKINEVLSQMKEDGTLAQLSKQFFDGEDVSVPQKVDGN